MVGKNDDEKDFRVEHDLSTVWSFFVFTIIFYFSLVSGENMFYANIFSFAHCSDLAISAVRATLLNSGLSNFAKINCQKFVKSLSKI